MEAWSDGVVELWGGGAGLPTVRPPALLQPLS